MRGRGHIGFSADPVGVGFGVGVGVTDLYPYLLTSWWNSTKFIWIYHWDKHKSWLGFGDLDLIFIFKVTVGLGDKFLYPQYLLNQSMDFLQICLDISLCQA